MWSFRTPLAISICIYLTGCGFRVPEIAEPWDQDVPGLKTAAKPDPLVPGVIDPTARSPRAPASATAQIEYEIKKRVYCDLRDAVHAAQYYDLLEPTASKSRKRDKEGRIVAGLPPDWIAKVSLSLTVDENVALNPGLSLITPLPNTQSYSTIFGGTLSSTATRVDKYNPTYKIRDLLTPQKYMVSALCQPGNDAFETATPPISPARSSPFLISSSDLGITDWLLGSALVNSLIPSSDNPVTVPEPERTCAVRKKKGSVTPAYLTCLRSRLAAMGYNSEEVTQIVASKSSSSAPSGAGGSDPKPDTISLEEKFIVISSGNVTPSWKLVRVSANTAAPFFGAGRTRTHDLVVTIGPDNQATQDAHNTLVGPSATATANRAGIQ